MCEISSLKIGLLWHSPNSDNLGVGALTTAHIAILEHVARTIPLAVSFKIIGWQDSGPTYVKAENIEIVALRARHLISPTGLYAALEDTDVVLDISAGDSFADIYGLKRFTYNILAKIIVMLAKRPLLLSPQTIGPFESWWTQALASRLMRKVVKIVSRDALSSSYLRQMGFGNKLVEATDVAFRLPYDPPAARPAGPVRVGLNVSGLLFNGGYNRDNMFSLAADYQKLARSLCTYFCAISSCELHLIGHVVSKNIMVEDDYRVAETLATEFPRAIVAPRFESPSAAKSYIATMDFFTGSRMHACIAAFSSGVPVLPIAYSRKFAGLFGTLGYDQLADCKTHCESEILHIVADAFERREELKAKVEIGRKVAESKLLAYENLLRTWLSEVACRSR
jgi:polysaccharide pyruvyl transferase WcaK-like protein